MVRLQRYEVTYEPYNCTPLLIHWLVCGRAMMIAFAVHSLRLTEEAFRSVISKGPVVLLYVLFYLLFDIFQYLLK